MPFDFLCVLASLRENLFSGSILEQSSSFMQNPQSLDNITIVLVDTKTPANIGATARCMMNMGLSRLILVNPPMDPDGEAFKLAAGADRILSDASTVKTLGEAIIGHNLVIGTSRHPGRLRKNIGTPREMAGQVASLLSRNKAAVVFGSEVNGLDNQDLALCQEIIAIPASDAFPSLNLSHAVMVVAYEFFLATQGAASRSESNRELAGADDLERFFHHLQETLIGIGFFGKDKPERMMATLRQIFGRARLEERDVAILRGILSAVDRINAKHS